MTDKALTNSYERAYKNAHLDNIKGDLEQRDGTVIKKDVTPRQAFDALLEWADLD